MFGFPDGAHLTYERLCEDDRQLVDALTTCGADLDEARHVLHYIEVETEAIAERMASLGAQWLASISPPTQDDETWFVVFERDDRVLSAQNILADRHLSCGPPHPETKEGPFEELNLTVQRVF